MSDNIRHYAAAAFIRFGKLGQPTRAEYEEKIKERAKAKFEGERDLSRALEVAEPILRDLDAVDKTLRILRGELDGGEDLPAFTNGTEIAAAISAVYFGLHREKPSPARITYLVRSYALRVAYIDERTVYRWIAKGREIFAHVRGLAIDTPKIKKRKTKKEH